MTPPGGPFGRVARVVAAGIGTDELAELEQRCALLEEAVAENELLREPLRRYLAELEAGLVPLIERDTETSGD